MSNTLSVVCSIMIPSAFSNLWIFSSEVFKVNMTNWVVISSERFACSAIMFVLKLSNYLCPSSLQLQTHLQNNAHLEVFECIFFKLLRVYMHLLKNSFQYFTPDKFATDIVLTFSRSDSTWYSSANDRTWSSFSKVIVLSDARQLKKLKKVFSFFPCNGTSFTVSWYWWLKTNVVYDHSNWGFQSKWKTLEVFIIAV